MAKPTELRRQRINRDKLDRTPIRRRMRKDMLRVIRGLHPLPKGDELPLATKLVVMRRIQALNLMRVQIGAMSLSVAHWDRIIEQIETGVYYTTPNEEREMPSTWHCNTCSVFFPDTSVLTDAEATRLNKLACEGEIGSKPRRLFGMHNRYFSPACSGCPIAEPNGVPCTSREGKDSPTRFCQNTPYEAVREQLDKAMKAFMESPTGVWSLDVEPFKKFRDYLKELTKQVMERYFNARKLALELGYITED